MCRGKLLRKVIGPLLRGKGSCFAVLLRAHRFGARPCRLDAEYGFGSDEAASPSPPAPAAAAAVQSRNNSTTNGVCVCVCVCVWHVGQHRPRPIIARATILGQVARAALDSPTTSLFVSLCIYTFTSLTSPTSHTRTHTHTNSLSLSRTFSIYLSLTYTLSTFQSTVQLLRRQRTSCHH
jgi:hypothetical protein